MKSTATGRILFWRGGSLWIGLAGEPAVLHAHHAVQITLPLSGDSVQFQGSSGVWTSYTAALVTAHQPHAFAARAQHVAQLFVEPETHEGRQLQRRYRNEGIVELPSGMLAQQIAGLAAAYERRAADSVLIELARAAITELSGAIPESGELPDSRIARAVELIRERLGEPIPLGRPNSRFVQLPAAAGG